jgi:hypothetical protein
MAFRAVDALSWLLGMGLCDILCVEIRMKFICEGDRVIMMNSMVYAMKVLQGGMAGEAEKVGLLSKEDVDRMLAEMRAEEIE